MKRREWKERQEIPTSHTQHSHSRTFSMSSSTRFYMQQFWWCHHFSSSQCPSSQIAHLWQIANMICVEQQLFEASRVPQNFFWNGWKRAMTLIHKLHLTIASFEDWNALEHCLIYLSKLLARRFFTSHYTKKPFEPIDCFLFCFSHFYQMIFFHINFNSFDCSFGTWKH